MNYADEYIRRALRINRVSDSEIINANERIKSLSDKITLLLANLANNNRSEVALNISRVISEEFSHLSDVSDRVTRNILRKELIWHEEVLAAYSGRSIVPLNPERVVESVRSLIFKGRSFQEWYRQTSATLADKAIRAINSGFITGQNITQITDTVKTVTGVSGKNVRTLVRSNILSTANQARTASVDNNVDLFDGKIWVSTLDIRTTPELCGIRDGLEYSMTNEPLGHDIPWEGGPGELHFNCRSTWIPKITGVDIATRRPSVDAGDSYNRGDHLTATGKVKKAVKKNRDDGTFSIGSRNLNSTNYEDWLRKQPKDFISDALGSSDRAQSFLSGSAVQDVTGAPFGAPISLNDL